MKHREGKILVSIVIVMVIFMLLDITHSSYDEKIENSVAVYKNLTYFADNGGWLQCIDLNTLQPVWIKDVTDDTDSTIVIEEEPEGQVVLYTACEVDKQGSIGVSYIRKIDALSGQLIIFNLARCGGFNKGLLIALNKSSGDEVWSLELPSYSWSSPVDVYTENGDGYIILCDSAGRMYLIDGMNGTVLDCISLGANIEGSPAVFEDMVVAISLGANIEASPAVFEDMVVVGTRGQKIFGIKIR